MAINETEMEIGPQGARDLNMDYPEHERTYKKFTHFSKYAAFAFPFFFAFVLYWTQ